MDLSTHALSHILILRSGAVGDFILTTPVLASLRSAYPDAQIQVLSIPERACLAGHLVDQVYDINEAEWARLFVPNANPPPTLAQRNVNLIINYLPDPDQILTRNLETVGSHVITHEPHPPLDGSIHVVDHLLSAITPLGIPLKRQPSVQSTPPLEFTPKSPFFVLHPGSGGRSKIWPLERFAEVARHLSRSGDVVVTSGPADSDTLGRFRSLLPEAAFMPVLPLQEFAGLLERADLFIGNDSGPSHLAAAVGTPVIAIFGPTDPRIWSPIGSKVDSIVARDADSQPESRLDAISSKQVIESVNRLISQQIRR